MKKHLILVAILNLSLLIACTPSSDDSHTGQKENTASTPSQNEPLKGTNAPQEEETDHQNENALRESPSRSGEKLDQIGFDLMGNEKFGDLKLNLTTDEVIKIIGNPSKKTEEEYWGADGGQHSNWVYDTKGITLGMNRIEDHPESKYHNKLVDAITIKAPSDLKTNKGIKIGSSIDDVMIGYQRTMETTEAEEGWLIAGTIYGGLMFKVENGQVVEMFLGAKAE